MDRWQLNYQLPTLQDFLAAAHLHFDIKGIISAYARGQYEIYMGRLVVLGAKWFGVFGAELIWW